MSPARLAPLAVSMGEPAGIGPDLILGIHAARADAPVPPFAVYGNAQFLGARARRLGLHVDCAPVNIEDAAATFSRALPVIEIGGDADDLPGEPKDATANLVTGAISRAVGDTLIGAARALVTAPIHKGALYKSGFDFPGHTEYLAHLCAGGGKPPMPVMMLAHDGYRTVPATIHVPLADVPSLVNTELVVRTARIVHRDLVRRFGITNPVLAITGLNPHAGEGGAIGREDIEEIAPAIALLQREGIDAHGPLPADTVFHPPHWRRYDAVIAMYHDQALIPIKTLAFDEGVNVTLGLPIVRTSPDHGTAFDLAGTGKASAKSMLAAIRLADQLSRPRA
ncbi:MAG TPA: 4-hydroxythreonine-4-phosphate dehydrogenase PdxA [Devosiaceae bacterium]